jgi:zinc protease
MKTRTLFLSAAVGALVVGMGCGPALAQTPAPAEAPAAQPLMPIERFQLANGLNVVLAAHVGSAREEPGRTGFAHLFEHLFFLDSENLGPGGLDAMSARIGGSGANGSTSRDLTDYLQTVPNDALEKMIWAEADKLGYFINTVTDAVLAKEKQVVKNEKRQSYDNQPYGHTSPVISAALYPADHPYNWEVIGSLADLDAATLSDVRNFYRRWYTPDNTTLVVAGDFDPAQARVWIEKYFGEIARGPGVPTPTPRPAALQQTVRLMHEDGFAQLPELTLAWPTVERGHPDEAALDMLQTLLTDGKDAPLNAVLIDEKKLTSQVGFGSQNAQIAGEAYLIVRAFDGVDLDAVQAALDEGFARFETQGVDAAALQRVKTTAEADFYAQLDSVLGKGAALARYDAFGGSPDRDLARLRAVTADDVMRVYRQYIAGRPHVATSFTPRGQAQLALEGSAVATVVEEPIIQGAEAPVDQRAGDRPYERTPSSFDRTGPPPLTTPPLPASPPGSTRPPDPRRS